MKANYNMLRNQSLQLPLDVLSVLRINMLLRHGERYESNAWLMKSTCLILEQSHSFSSPQIECTFCGAMLDLCLLA